MLKFSVAYPFKRADIVEAGTSFQPNKTVRGMNSNLSNLLQSDMLRFGFSAKGPSKTMSKSGPGMQSSPSNQ